MDLEMSKWALVVITPLISSQEAAVVLAPRVSPALSTVIWPKLLGLVTVWVPELLKTVVPEPYP